MDLIDEVSEDLKQERFDKLTKKLVPYIVGGVILIIIATIIYVWWQESSKLKKQELGSQFISAIELLNDLEYKKASSQLNLITDNYDGDINGLANLLNAAISAQEGNDEYSKSIIENLMDGDHNLLVKDMATLYLIKDRLNNKQINDNLKQRILQVATPSSPFKGTAKLMLALFHSMNSEKDDKQLVLEEILNDETLPFSVKNQAFELQRILD